MNERDPKKRAQKSGESDKESNKPETIVKSVLSFEFLRGIAFNERAEPDKIAKGFPNDFPKIIVDQTQQPPLYILTLFSRASEASIAKNLGKERGYNYSYLGVILQLDPSTSKLHVDFDLVASTLKEAGVYMNLSGEDLIERVEKVIREEASVDDIQDEDNRRKSYIDFKKREEVLLAQQEELDVYLGLGDEIKRRLLNFKSGDNLDISGTTLVLPFLSNNHPQASNEIHRIELGMILPAIDIRVVPSSKEGKIADTLPNFDPQILSAGRDLTVRLVTAFEALKPKT